MKLINALPEAPLLTDAQNTFNNKAFAFVDALDGFVSDTNEVAVELNSLSQTVSNNANSAAEAKTQAQNFSVSAKESSDQAATYAQSVINSPSTQATSSTNLAIGNGDKSLTINENGKTFVRGQFVQVVNKSTFWMIGMVSAFNPSTRVMSLNIVSHLGLNQAYSEWVISAASPPSVDSAKVVASASFSRYSPVWYMRTGHKNVSSLEVLGVGSYLIHFESPIPGPGLAIGFASFQSDGSATDVGRAQLHPTGTNFRNIKFFNNSGVAFDPIGFEFVILST